MATIEKETPALREQVRAGAQNRPGVYRMLSGTGVVLYVGKSKQLRTRLLGYFRARPEEKAWRIVREAQALEWEYVPSEFASLLRELQLIKKFRPPYNVQQKRDRLYAFLRMSPGPAPRLHVVRQVTDQPGRYFGPFRGGKRIGDAVRELNDVLELRDCRGGTPIRFADQRELFEVDRVPLCPRHELRRCMAPCAALCTEGEYDRNVALALGFLMGRSSSPLELLEQRMHRAAERMEFEHAANIRDRMDRLHALREEFLSLHQALQTLTFLYTVPGAEGKHRVYAIRSGSIRDVYPAPRSAAERRRLIRRASEHFSDPERPTDTTAPARIDEILLVAHWFRTKPEEHARTYAPERWDELPLARRLDREDA